MSTASKARPYLLDTNVYIAAYRDATFAREIAAFARRGDVRLYLSAVVVHELLVSELRADRRRDLIRQFVMPFVSARRLIGTDLAIWQDAAAVAACLRESKTHQPRLREASFRHDILIAASCRRIGATLITANVQDFAVISEALAFRLRHELPS